MRSMTGFGLGSAPLGSGQVTLELRALNHRHQDVRLRLPSSLAEHTFFLEQQARAELGRGRYDIGVRVEGAVCASVELDEARAEAAYLALARTRDRLAPGTELRVDCLLLLPELFVAKGPGPEEAQSALRRALDAAVRQLLGMQRAEGSTLRADLERRASDLGRIMGELETSSGELLSHQKSRLSERVHRLLSSAGHQLEPGRLEQEIALLADKSDITEELVRLGSHLVQFQELLSSEEPVGRRLDFLLQEMGREVNTIGSKCQHAPLAHLVVEAKAQVERLREQVQNVD